MLLTAAFLYPPTCSRGQAGVSSGVASTAADLCLQRAWCAGPQVPGQLQQAALHSCRVNLLRAN